MKKFIFFILWSLRNLLRRLLVAFFCASGTIYALGVIGVWSFSWILCFFPFIWAIFWFVLSYSSKISFKSLSAELSSVFEFSLTFRVFILIEWRFILIVFSEWQYQLVLYHPLRSQDYVWFVRLNHMGLYDLWYHRNLSDNWVNITNLVADSYLRISKSDCYWITSFRVEFVMWYNTWCYVVQLVASV